MNYMQQKRAEYCRHQVCAGGEWYQECPSQLQILEQHDAHQLRAGVTIQDRSSPAGAPVNRPPRVRRAYAACYRPSSFSVASPHPRRVVFFCAAIVKYFSNFVEIFFYVDGLK